MKEKILYIGRNFDSNEDGKLSRTELTKFFGLFYEFTLEEKDFKTLAEKENIVKKYSNQMTNTAISKSGAQDIPGVSLAYLASLEKSNF